MTRPIPARLSPRAGAGTRRFLRRARSYGWLVGLVLAVAVCVGIPLLTRGQYWTGNEWAAIPTGGVSR